MSTNIIDSEDASFHPTIFFLLHSVTISLPCYEREGFEENTLTFLPRVCLDGLGSEWLRRCALVRLTFPKLQNIRNGSIIIKSNYTKFQFEIKEILFPIFKLNISFASFVDFTDRNF